MGDLVPADTHDHTPAITGTDDMRDSFVTFYVAGQLFGIPIERVNEILIINNIYSIPMSPEWIDGSINVRGRIVMVVNLRNFMGMQPAENRNERHPCIIVTHGSDLYGLIVDSVGDVMEPEEDTAQATPSTLSPKWKSFTERVYRLEGRKLLLELNANSILGSPVHDKLA